MQVNIKYTLSTGMVIEIVEEFSEEELSETIEMYYNKINGFTCIKVVDKNGVTHIIPESLVKTMVVSITTVKD